jgi:transketolase
MLQYALIHLFGYKVSIDDLKSFRVSLSCKAMLYIAGTRC